MPLSDAYTLAVGRIPDVFAKIRDGQAPNQFSAQLLKDWGFNSSNDRAMIPVLKALGFLSPDGKPTSLYQDYRDHSRSRTVMGQALRTAYSDIFLIKERPTEVDKAAIQGKFKSFHNVSDNVASIMTKTFYGLLGLADLETASAAPITKATENEKPLNRDAPTFDSRSLPPQSVGAPGLYYNIQIHLPPTKDIEVYNAIFKSLREHLLAG